MFFCVWCVCCEFILLWWLTWDLRMKVIEVLWSLFFSLNVAQAAKQNITHNNFVDTISDQALAPNLFFVGISKCGTTSLSRILNKHPLVVGVGNEDGGVFGESHIYDKVSDMDKAVTLQVERLRSQLRKKTKDEVNNITRNGIILHYTPHYAGVDEMEDKILKSVRKTGASSKNVKYLFMIRSPASRAVSSWWYKSRCYKLKCPHPPKLQPHIVEGFAKARKLEDCYYKIGYNFTDLVLQVRRGAYHSSAEVKSVLDKCPIKMLTTQSGGNTMYSAHIGKSLYAHQLIHWLASIRKAQIYIMVLDNFVADPIRELQLLFNWLKVPLYGEYGYDNEKVLLEIANEKHNVHPIPEELQSREVAPRLANLTESFGPSIKQLCMLLSDKEEGEYGVSSCSEDWKGIVNMMKHQHESKYGTLAKVKVTVNLPNNFPASPFSINTTGKEKKGGKAGAKGKRGKLNETTLGGVV